ALIAQGIQHMPTIGDGRQSGTSESPSILNASPEAAIGGGLAFLQTGDMVRLDIPNRKMDALVPAEEWQARKDAWRPPELVHHTPWQELQRAHVGHLSEGGCLEMATRYQRTAQVMERDNH
ncbi:MAG: dihydroxy-acid dehydratase, partial [Pseudomonadota bacterium]